MIDGTSTQAFEQSIGQIIRNLSIDERKRLIRSVANLISAGWEASGSHDGALLRLHGMSADEVVRQGEGMKPGTPLEEGEVDGVRYTLFGEGRAWSGFRSRGSRTPGTPVREQSKGKPL